MTAGGLSLCRRRPDLREAISVAGGLALAALLLSIWFAPDQDLRFELWTWLPDLPLVLQLEPLGLLFATLAGLLWPVTTVYSIGYMRSNHETNQTRYYVFFALAIAAAQLIALSGDLVTLFIGYELLTLSTWPLVAHTGDAGARRGARIYLVLLLVTSIGLLLPAIIWTGWLAGSLEFAANPSDGGLLAGHASAAILTVLFALYLFGIGKAALMPFHRWLPSAMVAPTPVSALLHAVAVVKAGVFAVLKVSIYVFGIDLLDTNGTTTPMMWVAAVTLLGAGLVALTRDDLKARLAYSTVSQLAYVVLAATLATGTAAAGGALQIVTHAAAKITLFFCAGAIYVAARKTRLSQLDGLGRAMPWTFGAWVVASLSIAGLPPFGGTWSKLLLLEGAVEADQAVMMGVMLVGSLLSLAYLMPVPVRAFFRPAPDAHNHGEAPVSMVLPLVLTAGACVALFFGADAVIGPVSDLLGTP
jgi:multicomponent Na+:H+ antiporter subunit D